MRRKGLFDPNGNCKFEANFEQETKQAEYHYTGETSVKDWAHGYGVATNPSTGFTITGHFRNSKATGVMILKYPDVKTEIQGFKLGKRFGRGTTYFEDGKTIRNYVWLGGVYG